MVYLASLGRAKKKVGTAAFVVWELAQFVGMNNMVVQKLPSVA